jgi:TonB family protein
MEMDCIMVDQPLKSEALPPLGLFPTYCLEPGKDDLRVTTEFGSVTFIRTRMGRFQNKSVAVEVNGELLGKTAITAQVSALTGAKLTAVDFQETPGMEKTGTGQIRMSGSVIAGSIINKIQPLYPDSAKRNHIQGTVILHGIIGTDGHVHSLHIISTPDPDLAIASIFAVRQWTYKPYLLNGLPTEVDTTMTVNFSFGPG